MTTAPAEDQHRLLDLQALDTRLQQLAHSHRTHPARATVEELGKRLADLDDVVVRARTEAGDIKREVAKAEADVAQVRSRAERDRAKVDSGVLGAKDLQGLTSELESLARRQEALEEIELEAMERLEAAENHLAEVTRSREEVANSRDAALTDLEGALADLVKERTAVQAERAPVAAGIDPGLLALYDKLREQLGGLAAARLRGRTCEGCRLELNAVDVARLTASDPDEVARCEECGRILVRS